MKKKVKYGKGAWEEFANDYQEYLDEGYEIIDKKVIHTQHAGFFWYFVLKDESFEEMSKEEEEEEERYI